MKKLRGIIEKLLEGKQIRGIYCPPATVYELMEVYNTLVRKEKCETINSTVVKVVDHCKIRYEEKGIGWVIG